MGYYILHDQFDHFLDELAYAQRAYGTVYAYVKSLEQRTEQDSQMISSISIAVTWVRSVERIIHAGRMTVNTIRIDRNDPQGEHQIAQLRQRARMARRRIYAELMARPSSRITTCS